MGDCVAGITIQILSPKFEELADVLTRPSVTRRLAIISKTAHEVRADYVDAVELVEPLSVPRVVPDDPDDDQVIAAHGDLIVSGDSDLLSMGNHHGMPIVTAAQAAQRIGR